MRYSDEELRRMKARRRELVAEYGDKGQHHPMGRMIGGLNPAAQELHVLRGKIAEAEGARRGPQPVMTPLPGSKGRYGLKFDIEYQGRRGKLGTDNFGRWYIVIGEGSEAGMIASDLKTKGEAAKAFARLSKAQASEIMHHATKKPPAQLQREINEALAKEPVFKTRTTQKTTRGKPVSKPGPHGTLYRYSIVYTDQGDPGFGEATWNTWAYDSQHAVDRFYESPEGDTGWVALRIARQQESPAHRWTWHALRR